mgnify:CR=1 FL=1
MSICTAYLPYRYVERWGGCADECHEIVIWQASPRCGINSLSHLSLMSWTDIYRVTRCVLGRSGVTAAGIYALRLLKAGCASSAVGSLRPLCDGCRVRPFHEKSHITDCCHPDEKSSTLTSSITDGPMPKAVPSTSRTVRYQEPGPSGKAPHITERIVSIPAIAQGMP